jgi:hypothetical protein
MEGGLLGRWGRGDSLPGVALRLPPANFWDPSGVADGTTGGGTTTERSERLEAPVGGGLGRRGVANGFWG